jgi:hypothetical protein
MSATARRYTEEDRADALALMEAYRGDLKRVARDLEIPVPILKGWQEGKPARPVVVMRPPDLRRPWPTEELLQTDEERGLFAPAPEVAAWMRDTFILEGTPLHNAEHEHLEGARIGVLWTNVGYVNQGRIVMGQAEIPKCQGNRWLKARVDYQMQHWFSEGLDFLITLHAPIAAELSDAGFCALCEHEMLHCGQKKDAFGAPMFNRMTGAPVFCVRGHDVEEFVSVVWRYGAGAASAAVTQLVEAASRAPKVAAAEIAAACGTCLKAVG